MVDNMTAHIVGCHIEVHIGQGQHADSQEKPQQQRPGVEHDTHGQSKGPRRDEHAQRPYIVVGLEHHLLATPDVKQRIAHA